MRDKKSKTKKQIKVQDLKPKKDARGGVSVGTSTNTSTGTSTHTSTGHSVHAPHGHH